MKLITKIEMRNGGKGWYYTETSCYDIKKRLLELSSWLMFTDHEGFEQIIRIDDVGNVSSVIDQ